MKQKRRSNADRCQLDHRYRSVSHQPQLFSPQGGPFEYDSLLIHIPPTQTLPHTAAPASSFLLQTPFRAQGWKLKVHSLSCLELVVVTLHAASILSGQYREHVRAETAAPNITCVSMCCKKWSINGKVQYQINLVMSYEALSQKY